MAPVEHTESPDEDASSRSASSSPVSSSSPSSIDGRLEEATVCTNCVCSCQNAKQRRGGVVHQERYASFKLVFGKETFFWSVGSSLILLVRLDAHRSFREVRVVVAYIQKIEGDDSVVVYSRFGFGKVARSAILERWSIDITDNDMERMKDEYIDIVGGSLEDLPMMTEMWEGSILSEPADPTSSSNNKPSSSSPSNNEPSSPSSSNHSRPSRWYQQQQQADEPRPRHVRPAHFAPPQQQQPEYQHVPHFHNTSSVSMMPELKPAQGFMLPAGFQPNTAPGSTTVNYIVVSFSLTTPSGLPAQNGMSNQNVAYYYQPVAHQTPGCDGQ